MGLFKSWSEKVIISICGLMKGLLLHRPALHSTFSVINWLFVFENDPARWFCSLLSAAEICNLLLVWSILRVFLFASILIFFHYSNMLKSLFHGGQTSKYMTTVPQLVWLYICHCNKSLSFFVAINQSITQ